MDEQYVYVDSRLSASSANSYTVYLNTPLYSVSRVDLVSACIPTLATQNTLSTSDPYIFLDIEQFRSKYGVQGCRSNLATSNNRIIDSSPTIYGYMGHIFYGDVSSSKVNYTFSTINTTGNTTTSGNVITFGNVVTRGNTITTGNIVTSGNTANVNTFTVGNVLNIGNVFTIGNTFSLGNTLTFGNVITTGNTLTVYTYQNVISYINYTENQYKSSVTFKQPIESVDKLNIRWVDRFNNTVPFSAHSFMLRVYTVRKSIEDYTHIERTEHVKSTIDVRVYLIIAVMIICILLLMGNRG